MSSPQLLGSSIRHYLDSYDGFDNSSTGEVAMPATGTRAVTIRCSPWIVSLPADSIVRRQRDPGDSGTWLRYGKPINVTLTTGLAGAFTGWSGSRLATLAGKPTIVSTTIGATVPGRATGDFV